MNEIINYIPEEFKDNIIYIFTTRFGFYVSNVIRYVLESNNIVCKIIYEEDYNYTLPNLFIILFSQKIKQYPKNYIIYQLEQKDISKWIDKKYELSILFSIITLDYSQSNINKFPEIIKKKMIYYPIPLVNSEKLFNPIFRQITNDILFYGSLNNIRKQKLDYIQKKISPRFKIKIINNLYGIDLYNEILSSKIVLNIHFYKNAILETCRINEILSCNKIVISELPDKIDFINYNMYKNMENLFFINSIDDMIKKIFEILG